MAELLHSKQTSNHILENWTYATAAARIAATGFVAADVGKISYQLDEQSYWRLTATTPTWVQVSIDGEVDAVARLYAYFNFS